ncbi:MAG: hypothetical protein JWM19_4634 [Actinomycetia bacterium]|nr:hypothetical protein [Actinomycetes bacterium]
MNLYMARKWLVAGMVVAIAIPLAACSGGHTPASPGGGGGQQPSAPSTPTADGGLSSAAGAPVTATATASPSTTAPASANATAAASPAPPQTVYAITFTGNSALYSLSPRSDSETLKGYTGVELTDITAAGKILYAISFTDLYRLDAATGASHDIGSLGFSTANALVTQPNTGTLYGADESGDFFTINQDTGHATLVGTFGGGLGSAGDLAFYNGLLYAAVSEGGSAESYLATVDVRTGAATIVGNTGYANVWGVVAGSGALYGATDGGLFLAISPTTGRAKALWQEGLAVGGMAVP